MTAKTVWKAADRVKAEQLRLEIAIREYHSEGASLREIATAAKISHETVRRILSR